MKKNLNFKQLATYISVFVVFCVVALVYFKPVLSGEKIYQSDIAQFTGMSKELKDFRQTNGKEAYWTDAAFGGMPSYQLSTYYPHDYIQKLDRLIRFLPRPADYLFLYFFGFFVLLSVLKFDWKLALIGSLAFGFSTYFIIILGVGHNAKAHAIGYIPLVLSGILLLFRKKYAVGFLVTALAMALEVNTSHPQMTYYMLFFLLFIGLFYCIEQFRTKKIQQALKPIVLIVLAMVVGVCINAQSLLATKEYASHSTRSKSELTINADGTKKTTTSSGLSRDYITQYSYGLLETVNLMIPRLTGGANNESLGLDSNLYTFLAPKIGRAQAKNFVNNAPTYWGSQPIVAAPAYIGAIFVFLFFVGCFLVRGWLKKGIITAVIFSILMSWGKNFSFLTDLFIDFVPLYNKFRAVSSIQIIAEIGVPLLAMLALKDLFSLKRTKEDKIQALKIGGGISLGIVIVFGFLGSQFYAFTGSSDANLNQRIPGFLGAIQADRKDILFSDSIRTLFLILISLGVLWSVVSKKIKQQYAIVVMGCLLLFDTVGVARRYVNDDDFLPASKVEKPFRRSVIDKQILEDKGHYRVMNLAGNFMNDGATSYYHKSMGGYHAAKLRRYQELADFHISNNNIEVFHMLNAKYFIVPSEKGGKSVQQNPEANGNAWFVEDVIKVTTADEEIVTLSKFNSKKQAVINTNEFSFKEPVQDTTAVISLKSYKANQLIYTTETQKPQLAVFSEIYYQPGWNAYIDGVLKPHFRANYVLRGLNIPKGKHVIEFKFEPKVIQQGSVLSLIGYALLVILSVAFVVVEKRKKD